MEELNEILQQSGIKGMHWGVRRNSNRDRAGGADGKPDSQVKPIPKSKLGRTLNSLKRERQWKTVLGQIDSMTTKEIGVAANRLNLENSLKSLSRTKGVGTKKDTEDYHRREHMDDLELSRKVKRLQAKSNLHKAVHAASKEQRELGQKIVHIGTSVGIRYALTKTRPELKDLFETYKNPKASADKAKGDLLKVALEKVKEKHAKATS